MLGALEALLLPALQSGLEAGQDALAGPAGAPAEGSTGRLAVFAARLACERAGDEEPVRDPAFLGWQGMLTAAADPLVYPLPDAALGELIEVQSPPGRILARDDAYLPDGRKLRFFRPPPGPVVARTRGPRSAGYRERCGGRIELELRAWAKDAPTVDQLLAGGLAGVLGCFEQFNVIELAGAPPSLTVRLAKPRAGLAGLERRPDPAAPEWLLGTAQCVIRGELELALTLGAPEPESLIRGVDIALHLPRKP